MHTRTDTRTSAHSDILYTSNHTYASTDTYTQTHTYTHIHSYTQAYSDTRICTYTHTDAHTHTHTYTQVHIYTHVHTYTHTHTCVFLVHLVSKCKSACHVLRPLETKLVSQRGSRGRGISNRPLGKASSTKEGWK